MTKRRTPTAAQLALREGDFVSLEYRGQRINANISCDPYQIPADLSNAGMWVTFVQGLPGYYELARLQPVVQEVAQPKPAAVGDGERARLYAACEHYRLALTEKENALTSALNERDEWKDKAGAVEMMSAYGLKTLDAVVGHFKQVRKLEAELAALRSAPAPSGPAQAVPDGHCTCNDPLALGVVHRDPEDGPCFVHQGPAQAVQVTGAVRDVLAERGRQDAKWGGPAHDDEHSAEDWERYIMKRIPIASRLERSFRRRMVEISALAVAAIESCDRKVKFIEAAEHQLGDEWIEEHCPNLSGCVTRQQEATIREWLDEHQDRVMELAEELRVKDEAARKSSATTSHPAPGNERK